MSLYTQLKEAGIETSSHESDLYFPGFSEGARNLGLLPAAKEGGGTVHQSGPRRANLD